MMDKQRAGYTKMGFSKPFACCGHHAICEMGKGTCVYKERDPDTMRNCLAYRRQQKAAADIKVIETKGDGQLALSLF